MSSANTLPRPVPNPVLVDRSHWTYKSENRLRPNVKTFKVSGVKAALSIDDLTSMLEARKPKTI